MNAHHSAATSLPATSTRGPAVQPSERYWLFIALVPATWVATTTYTWLTHSAFSSTWWTEPQVRGWLDLGVLLIGPLCLAAIAEAGMRRHYSVRSIALIPAISIGFYLGYRETTPLGYEYEQDVLFATFWQQALRAGALGLVIPVALRWRALLDVK